MSDLMMAKEFEALRQAALSAHTILLTGPSDSDGDSLGATLALQGLFAQLPGAAREIRVAHDGPWDARYRGVPGVERIEQAADLSGWVPDLAILCDGVRHRIGEMGPIFDAAQHRVLFDHHRSSVNEGDQAGIYTQTLVDPDSASTCEMVHALALAWDLTPTKDIAHALYVGIIFDTGVFRYSCTKSSTHRVAAQLLDTGIDIQGIVEEVVLDATPSAVRLRAHVLSTMRLESQGRCAWCFVSDELWNQVGAQAGDQEGLVNDMLFVTGVEVAALLTERASGLKLSMRSRGSVNVADLARSLSSKGGGHDRAAGATLEGPLEQSKERAVQALIAAADALAQ